MKKISKAVCVAALLLGNAFVGQAQTDFGGRIALVSAMHQRLAPMARVSDALRRCAVELRVENRTMPRIVLLEAGKEEARVADVGNWGKIYAEYIPSLSETIYMAWVLGEPTDADLAHIFVTILNVDLHLNMTETEVLNSARRVVVHAASTTNVDSLLSATHR